MGRSNNQTNNAITNGTAKKYPQTEERMAEFFANRSTNMSTVVLIAHETHGRNPGVSPIPEVMQERAKNMLMKKYKVDRLHYCTEECGKYFITNEMMRAHVLFHHQKWLPAEE